MGINSAFKGLICK